MTRSLQDAIARLEQMPEDRQDHLARLLLHEIEEDEKWARTTDVHATKLADFVEGILEADRRGECQPLDPDRL